MIKIVLLLLVAYIAFVGFRFFQKIHFGNELAKSAVPFSYKPENPDKRILIAGDSLGVGTGAASPEDTIAGRFHNDFPNALIINVSKNGAQLKDVANQLNETDGHFDLIIMTGGANDIIHFRNPEGVRSDAELVTKTAKEKSDEVVWVVSGNIGLAPIWPWPLGPIYTHETRKYHTELRSVAEENNIKFINLFTEKREDIFSKDPKKYYASDGLHLTGEGYKVWYERIKAQAKL